MVDKIPENNLNRVDFTKKKSDTPQTDSTPTVPMVGETKPDLDKGVSVQKAEPFPDAAYEAWGINNLSEEEIAARKEAAKQQQGELKEPQSVLEKSRNNFIYNIKESNFSKYVANLLYNVVGIAAQTYAAIVTAPVSLSSCSNDLNEPVVDTGAEVTVEINIDEEIIDQLDKTAPDGGYKTKDGIKYEYKYDYYENKPYVEFENNFTHYIGERTDVDPNSATAALRNVFEQIGIDVPKKSTIVLTDVSTQNGSNSGKAGLSMSIARGNGWPADLKEIAEGKPCINFGVGDLQVRGDLEKVENPGVYNLISNGKDGVSQAGGLYIKSDDGREIYMQYETGFYTGPTDPHSDSPNDTKDCLVVYIKGSDKKFKEAYALTVNPNDTTNIMIGQINRERGTNFEFYNKNEVGTFNADVTAIDDLYNNTKLKITVDADATTDITIK